MNLERLSISEKFVLTPREAGEYVNISENTIRKLCEEGKIRAIRGGKEWKIPKPLLEEWVLNEAKGIPL